MLVSTALNELVKAARAGADRSLAQEELVACLLSNNSDGTVRGDAHGSEQQNKAEQQQQEEEEDVQSPQQHANPAAVHELSQLVQELSQQDTDNVSWELIEVSVAALQHTNNADASDLDGEAGGARQAAVRLLHAAARPQTKDVYLCLLQEAVMHADDLRVWREVWLACTQCLAQQQSSRFRRRAVVELLSTRTASVYRVLEGLDAELRAAGPEAEDRVSSAAVARGKAHTSTGDSDDVATAREAARRMASYLDGLLAALEILTQPAAADAGAVLEEDEQRPVQLQTQAIAHATVYLMRWCAALPADLTAYVQQVVAIVESLDPSLLMQVLVRHPANEELQLRLQAFTMQGVEWPEAETCGEELTPAAVEVIEAIEEATYRPPRFAPDSLGSAVLMCGLFAKPQPRSRQGTLTSFGVSSAVTEETRRAHTGADKAETHMQLHGVWQAPCAPRVISHEAFLINAHTFAHILLQQDGYKARERGVRLLRAALLRQQPASLDLTTMERLVPRQSGESGTSVLQLLIEHTSTAPTKTARDFCTATVHMYIACFCGEPRHCLLSMLLDTCPFDPMYQLLVSLLKREVVTALRDDADDSQRRFFTGGSLWSLVYLLIKCFEGQRIIQIAQHFTKLSATLNLLLFLLMFGPTHDMERVVTEDATGVWRHGVLGEIQGMLLEPLKRQLDQQKKQLQDRIQTLRSEIDMEAAAHDTTAQMPTPQVPSHQGIDLLQFAATQTPKQRQQLEFQVAQDNAGKVDVLAFLVEQVNSVIKRGQAHV